ncbi:MAG: glycosyltransferase [Solirubrobacterales bacterium]
MPSAGLTFGVIVCAYTLERLDDLAAAIGSLRGQRRPVDEIVIVIDHNDELLAIVARDFPYVTAVANAAKQGLSGARNTGVKAIGTDVIAFLDDDAEADAAWAERIVSHYSDPAVIGAGGYIEAQWATSRPAWFPREFDWVVGCSYTGMPDRVAEVRNMIGANMSLRSKVFDRVGGFSTEVGRVGKKPVGCEETELCIRALASFEDGRILYDPAARVTHKVTAERATWRYFRERCYMEGVSKAQVVRMAGAGQALSSERSYATRVLPLGVLCGLGDVSRGRVSGLGRAAAVIAGLLITTAGYLRGRLGKPLVTHPHGRSPTAATGA